MKIAQKLTRAVRYARTFGHVRHFRGHGVHSPFVYRVVREAAMRKREIIGEDQSLYNQLRTLGISRKRSVQVQNLYTICGCKEFVVDGIEGSIESGTMWIISAATEPTQITTLTEQVGPAESIICILYPRNSASRYRATRQAIDAHNGLSIDNIGFVSLHCNDKRLKQHIRI